MALSLGFRFPLALAVFRDEHRLSPSLQNPIALTLIRIVIFPNEVSSDCALKLSLNEFSLTACSFYVLSIVTGDIAKHSIIRVYSYRVISLLVAIYHSVGSPSRKQSLEIPSQLLSFVVI